MQSIKPSLETQLLFSLFLQVAAVSSCQQESRACSEEMMNATESLKNISEAIALLNRAGIVRMDVETVAVLQDRLQDNVTHPSHTPSVDDGLPQQDES